MKTYCIKVNYYIQAENETELKNILEETNISNNEYYGGYEIVEVEEDKKGYFKCIRDYFEDDVRYWKKGNLYEFHKHEYESTYNTETHYYYDVETELGTWGGVGIGYMLGEDEIEDYFEVV